MQNLLTLLAVLCFIPLFSQNVPGAYTNNQNETKTVEVVKSTAIIKNNRLLDYQKEIAVWEDRVYKKFTPKDIASFTVRDGDEELTFDSIDGMFFALRLYSGKATLHKYLRYIESFSNPGIVRVYLIRKPGEAKMKQVEAMGLSRLITKKTMLSAFEDCPAAKSSIEKDEIKIKDEDKLVEFVKFYESNCF